MMKMRMKMGTRIILTGDKHHPAQSFTCQPGLPLDYQVESSECVTESRAASGLPAGNQKITQR